MSGKGSVRELGWAVTLGVIALAACADPTGVSITTRYDLRFLDGARLPIELAPSYTIVGGSLDLVSDGTCRRTVRVRVEVDPMTSDQLESDTSWGCTWSRTGSSLSFTWTENGGISLFPAPGTIASSSIRQRRITLVFETGIICVRAPCPSTWTEVYERLDVY